MPNHVHLIAASKSEDGLRLAIGEAHRRYTRRVNFREGWRGHLWQGRFASFVMDQDYLLACARYVERNPVRAGLCRRPQDYPWSNAAAHLSGEDDILVQVGPLLELVPSWARHVPVEPDEAARRQLRLHGATGRPAGSERLVKRLEKLLGRVLRPGKPGRRKKPTRN